MCVLERLGHLGLERPSPDLQTGRRSKHVQDARAGGAVGGPVRVHDERTFVAAFVTCVPNKWHVAYLLRLFFAALRALAGLAAFLAGLAGGRFAATGLAGAAAGFAAGLAAGFLGLAAFAAADAAAGS